MKAIRTNATTIYEAVQTSSMVNLNFRKENNVDEIVIFGDILKNGKTVGRISFNKSNNHLSTYIEKYSELTKEEISSIYSQVPNCIQEALIDIPETIPSNAEPINK